MKILPFMSRGIAFLLPDGTLAQLPLHIFRGEHGLTVIRLGDNAIHFTEAGRFDGEEMRFSTGDPEGDPRSVLAVEALAQSVRNQGLAPETFYSGEGSPGHDAEKRSRAALEQLVAQRDPRKAH